MFSRFTQKAIHTIMLAQEEAKQFRHNSVGTEHILLGIIEEGDNIVLDYLGDIGISPETIRNKIEEKVEFGPDDSLPENMPFTPQVKQVLGYAWDEARQLGHSYVNVEHVFLALLRETTGVAAKVLNDLGITAESFKDVVFRLMGEKVEPQEQTRKKTDTPTLDSFGRDLTWFAEKSKLDPVIGRTHEISRIIQILSRRTKNNPVLTGEAGVGKTAIIEGLAQRIIAGNVPRTLKDKRVVALDLGLLVAGTKYRGEFEDRIKKIMAEITKAENIIIFVDELHTIIGTGSTEGSLDAANILKPALSRGEMQVIGATTYSEYRKSIEGDPALERRFQSVNVDAPTPEETLEILKGIRKRYEDFHKVDISDEALEAAVKLSTRYITDRQLPDKAIDLIDEAASKVMLESSELAPEIIEMHQKLEGITTKKQTAIKKQNFEMASVLRDEENLIREKIKKTPTNTKPNIVEKIVTAENISEVVSTWTGIPVIQLSQAETTRLLEMEKELNKDIIGQNQAIIALSKAVRRAKAGLKDPKRPTGSFLFLGPSGVGKSELAKILAKFMFGTEDAIVRIDMSEYTEKHTTSRLIGSPPGYVGYDEGGQLTEPIRRKPYSIVLFDEIEKASPEVINLLLQVLEDGRLTDSTGKTVDFKNTIIIMTSNAGAKFIQNSSSFGFSTQSNKEEADYQTMKEKIQDELKHEFRPEFLNRIDDTIIFRSLKKEDIKLIAKIMMNELRERVKNKEMNMELDEKAMDLIAEKGFDAQHGARPLRRTIQEYVEDPLADMLLSGEVKEGQTIVGSTKEEKINFKVKKARAPRKTTKKEKTED